MTEEEVTPYPHAPIISPWYRWGLIIVANVMIVVAILAGVALAEATGASQAAAKAACIGSNKSKAAVHDLIATIINRATTPAPDETPAQKARREASAQAYLQLQRDNDIKLAPEDCDNL